MRLRVGTAGRGGLISYNSHTKSWHRLTWDIMPTNQSRAGGINLSWNSLIWFSPIKNAKQNQMSRGNVVRWFNVFAINKSNQHSRVYWLDNPWTDMQIKEPQPSEFCVELACVEFNITRSNNQINTTVVLISWLILIRWHGKRIKGPQIKETNQRTQESLIRRILTNPSFPKSINMGTPYMEYISKHRIVYGKRKLNV